MSRGTGLNPADRSDLFGRPSRALGKTAEVPGHGRLPHAQARVNGSRTE